MSWYNPLSWGDESKSQTEQRGDIRNQAAEANAFANQSTDQFRALGAESEASRRYLSDLAQGKNSVTAEQLRQGLQQQLAMQRSAAAGAGPNNPMAARSALNNMGRAGYGMAGQQAVAGLQERNQANAQLQEAINAQRNQELQGVIQARGQALQGYGGYKPEGSGLEKWGGAITGAAAVLSDERLKTDIEDGDAASANALKKLRAFTFKYKDQKYGEGKQLGVMAQELERAGLKHTVKNTPIGKVVDGGKLATSLAAMVATQEKRLSKLESK